MDPSQHLEPVPAMGLEKVSHRARRGRIRIYRIAPVTLVLPMISLCVAVTAAPLPIPDSSLSFRNEIQHAIDRGLDWLLAHQDPKGCWSSADHPALTALVLMAFTADPGPRYRSNSPPSLSRGYRFLIDSVQPNGSIHRGTLVNYNTALSATALAAAGDPAYDEILRNARNYLVNSQVDLGEKRAADTPFDGGVGYGSKYPHSDLNNTLVALEAIRATDFLDRDAGRKPGPSLDWAAAVRFIQNCQNLPAYNRQEWVSTNAADRGGFVYYPGQSMAGGVTNPANGRVALRSYGSISYAGLLSYAHARLAPDDPRVTAVLGWLEANYTLDENPGMGAQGLYYYLHLMSKALLAAKKISVHLKDKGEVDWRQDLATRLINLQSPDGSWCNANNRWWEKDPALTTAYAVLSLARVERSLEP